MIDHTELVERQRRAIATLTERCQRLEMERDAMRERVRTAESRASRLDMAGRAIVAELRAARRVVECAQRWRQALDAPDGVVDAETALRAALEAYEAVVRGG